MYHTLMIAHQEKLYNFKPHAGRRFHPSPDDIRNAYLNSFGWNISDFQPKAGELRKVLRGKTTTDPIPHIVFSQKDVDAAEVALQGAVDRSVRAHKREEAKRAKKTAPVVMEPTPTPEPVNRPWSPVPAMGAENDTWAQQRLQDIANGTVPDTTMNENTERLINATAWVKEKISAIGDFLSQPFSSVKQTFRWLSRLVSW